MPDATPGPTLLESLMAPLTTLRGIGSRQAALIARAAGGERILDLLFHLPESFVDRRLRSRIGEAEPGEVVTLTVEVLRVERPGSARQPWRVIVRDESGTAELVYFRPVPPRLAPGALVFVSGRAQRFGDRLSLPHPDHVAPMGEDAPPGIDPVWRLTAGLHAGTLRQATARALEAVPALPEWLDPAVRQRRGWPGFAEALRALHAPAEMPEAGPRERLSYDELLAQQVALAWERARRRSRPGRALAGDGRLGREALARFGHPLTKGQRQAWAEIEGELGAARPMLRLLQGDVGSGKTLLALLAMLRAAEAGAQAALMAPTETLARQHHRTLCRLSPVPVALLTGSVTGTARRNTKIGLESGRTPLVVGTHALIQQTVRFRALALAVIDEQHRFGVHERLSLGEKGDGVHVLVMTATPIPRTLVLAQWGALGVTRLAGKPPGRQPVATSLHSLAMAEAVVARVGAQLAAGRQIYWVCPLVEESAAVDVAAAEARHAELAARFGVGVGLAHGRQSAEARTRALERFARGETRLLVATTVIEVGVDVPAASIMIIEHAERFGLAQLHQLRGRVGRGSTESFCLLLHEAELSEAARRRLLLLRDTEDGFQIADQDFALRGGGDPTGRRQSGAAAWRLAEPARDAELLHMAAQDAALLLERDPRLESERGRAVRLLLRLFERGEALKTLRAG